MFEDFFQSLGIFAVLVGFLFLLAFAGGGVWASWQVFEMSWWASCGITGVGCVFVGALIGGIGSAIYG